MAREVTVTWWCDVCLAENDENVAGEEVVLTLPGMRAPKSVDLCADHRAELLDPVEQLMAEYGKAVKADEAPRPKTGKGSARSAARMEARKYSVHARENIGPLFCQVPGCSGYNANRGYPNIDRVRSHVRQIHPEVSWEKYLARFGEPKTGVRPDGSVEEQLDLGHDEAVSDEVFECEECGKTYTFADTTRPSQALGVHKALKHGIRGTKHRPQSRAS